MKKKIYSRTSRIGCLLLALVFAVSWPTAAAANGKSTKKDETVYVNLNASGNVQSTTVSDWLHSDSGSARIADRSNLKDIQNVKSNEKPMQTGDSLTWVLNGGDSDGADIYYQGKTTDALPLKVSVSYTLNGKSVTPEQIAGKSGKVKITVGLKNTDAHTVAVDGKSVVMYTPMTAVVAATLPSDTFRNVTVNKGKIISDGNNQFVTFLAMPGLSESLDLKNCGVDGLDTLDLPETLEITADATDFTLNSIAVAATPALPSEDDLGDSDSFDDLQDDLDKLSSMQDNIEEADPDKEIRSLFTNPDRTAAARLIVDDVFDFYDLDTAAIDVLPQYVTDKNIKLYDRITSDMDKADVKYLLDNKVIRGLNDRLTDDNIAKAKIILKDYDDIETFKIGKLDRALKVMNHYDKSYDHLHDILNDAKHILYRLDDSDVDTLAALSDSGVRNSLSGTLESMQALSSSGLTSLTLTKDNVQALMESIMSDHPDLLKELVEGQLKALEVKDGYIALKDVQPLMSNLPLSETMKKELNGEITKSVTSDGIISKEDTDTLLTTLIGPLPETAEQTLESLADKDGFIKILKLQSFLVDFAKQQSGMLPEQIKTLSTKLTNELPQYVLLPESDIEDLVGIIIKDPKVEKALLDSFTGSSSEVSDLTDSLNGLLSSSANLNSNLTRELGSNYSSKLTSTLSNMGHLSGYIDDLQDDIDDLDEDDEADLEDDFDDAKSLLLNKDDMDYLISWANKLKGMKTDMDDNKDNISLLRDLINLNDDPKIKNFRSMYPTLESDIDEVRPILDSLKDTLDEPAVNASLHKLPETTASLMKTEHDIRNNRKIMDIFRLTTRPDTVSLFNETFRNLDEFTEKGTADNMRTLMDKKDAYTDLSDQYTIFTEAADGAETSVKFVYKTAEIDEPEPEEIQTVSTTESKDESGSGFWARIRSVWKNATNTISHLF